MRRGLCVFVLFGAPAWMRAGDDPFKGIWQLDVAKSALAPAQPGLELKGQAIVFESNGKDFVVTVRGFLKNGTSTLTKYSMPISGGAVTYSESAPKGVTVIAKRLDDSRIDFMTYRNGGLVSMDHASVSADGRELRVALQGSVDPFGNSVVTCSNLFFVLTQKCGMSVFVRH